jgi:glycogen debranching enzyme
VGTYSLRGLRSLVALLRVRVRPLLSLFDENCTDEMMMTVAPIRLDATHVQFISGSTAQINSTTPRDTSTTLRGLDSTLVPLSPIVATSHKDSNGAYSEIAIPSSLPAGSVIVFATWMDDLPDDLDAVCMKGVDEAFGELDLVDLNVVLYRADGEEKDTGPSPLPVP